MPRPSNQLRELARLGAHERLKELRAEIAAIRRAYPDLRSGRGDGVTPGQKVRRRRRIMSAAARKAVSERMKAYWAARRKAARK